MAKNTSDDRNFSGMEVIEETNVYANVEDKTFQHTGSERGIIRRYRSVTVCLVLLCVLLLTAVIVLCVLINTNNQKFNIKNKNITEERDHQLLTKYTNITKERDELIAKYNIITKQNEQLNQEKNKLRTRSYAGWIYYQSSLYFISSEKKNWTESRRYCRENGADLIIINNKEEQDFIQKTFDTDFTWIGFTDIDVEETWKWVDGSTLSYRFWGPAEPTGGTTENCALIRSSEWADYPCNDAFKCICETNIFK